MFAEEMGSHGGHRRLPPPHGLGAGIALSFGHLEKRPRQDRIAGRTGSPAPISSPPSQNAGRGQPGSAPPRPLPAPPQAPAPGWLHQPFLPSFIPSVNGPGKPTAPQPSTALAGLGHQAPPDAAPSFREPPKAIPWPSEPPENAVSPPCVGGSPLHLPPGPGGLRRRGGRRRPGWQGASAPWLSLRPLGSPGPARPPRGRLSQLTSPPAAARTPTPCPVMRGCRTSVFRA